MAPPVFDPKFSLTTFKEVLAVLCRAYSTYGWVNEILQAASLGPDQDGKSVYILRAARDKVMPVIKVP